MKNNMYYPSSVIINPGDPSSQLLGGLEPWNFIFPYIGNVIIPTDFHSIIFQRGFAQNHQPDYY